MEGEEQDGESVEKMDGKGTENEDTCTSMKVAENNKKNRKRKKSGTRGACNNVQYLTSTMQDTDNVQGQSTPIIHIQ